MAVPLQPRPSPWLMCIFLLFMLFYPFGKDIPHTRSANKIQHNLPRPILHDVVLLILSSLTTQAVSLSSGYMDLAQLTSNIFEKWYYFFTILHSAWSLICHSKKFWYATADLKKREKAFVVIRRVFKHWNNKDSNNQFHIYIASSNHLYLKTLAYVKYLM